MPNINITVEQNSDPVEGARFSCINAGTGVVVNTFTTDSFGDLTFTVDPGYYVVRQHFAVKGYKYPNKVYQRVPSGSATVITNYEGTSTLSAEWIDEGANDSEGKTYTYFVTDINGISSKYESILRTHWVLRKSIWIDGDDIWDAPESGV